MMPEWFTTLNPVMQALVATLGTYLLTAIGTTPVLLFRSAPRRLMDALMGGAAGIMVAASCWSLLQPAIEMRGTWPAVIGLVIGGLFIFGSHRGSRPLMSISAFRVTNTEKNHHGCSIHMYRNMPTMMLR